MEMCLNQIGRYVRLIGEWQLTIFKIQYNVENEAQIEARDAV